LRRSHRFALGCELIRGEWIAIDGSKFGAVASIDSTRKRLALQRYLDSIEEAGRRTMAYNLKRITNVLGAAKLTKALHHR
jgi:hypothetical protein